MSLIMAWMKGADECQPLPNAHTCIVTMIWRGRKCTRVDEGITQARHMPRVLGTIAPLVRVQFEWTPQSFLGRVSFGRGEAGRSWSSWGCQSSKRGWQGRHRRNVTSTVYSGNVGCGRGEKAFDLFSIVDSPQSCTPTPKSDSPLVSIASTSKHQFGPDLRLWVECDGCGKIRVDFRIQFVDIASARTQLVFKIVLGPSLIDIERDIGFELKWRQQPGPGCMNSIELIVTDVSAVLVVGVTGAIPCTVIERRSQSGNAAGNLELVCVGIYSETCGSRDRHGV